MERSELPFSVQEAGHIDLYVTFEGGSNYAVVSDVFREVACGSWAEVLETLCIQRDAVAGTGMPVSAIYYPNESAASARLLPF